MLNTEEYICYYYYDDEKDLSNVPAAYVLQQMGYEVYLSNTDGWVYIKNQGTIPDLSNTKYSLFHLVKYPEGYPFKKMRLYKTKIVKKDSKDLQLAIDMSIYMKTRERNKIRNKKQRDILK